MCPFSSWGPVESDRQDVEARLEKMKHLGPPHLLRHARLPQHVPTWPGPLKAEFGEGVDPWNSILAPFSVCGED